MTKASLTEKFSLIQEHWRPKIVAELNSQEVKLVKFTGVFPWHHHKGEDEMFLVWRGKMTIEFRESHVVLERGEFCVVPRGVEHRTIADDEAEVLIFEPAATRNTGNIVDEVFTVSMTLRGSATAGIPPQGYTPEPIRLPENWDFSEENIGADGKTHSAFSLLNARI